jgi:hypothetical protein
MINFFLTILLFIVPFLNAAGQNLVQNPSFEIYSPCPTGVADIANAVGWNSYNQTPDYFNSCAPAIVCTPSNFAGYQVPHTGNAYCGIITFNKVGLFREIIGSQLFSPLVIGQKYYVSFYTSLAISQPNFCYATNKIGAKFTTTAYNAYSNPFPIDNIAQVHYDTIITDTTNWTLIYGSFIADSAYQYIAIGNFFDDLNTDTSCIKNVSNKLCAYYYVDDICVSINPLDGMNEFSNENAIILNQNDPNPFAEETDITYFLPETVGSATIMFYDNTGVIIKSVQLQNKGNGTLHVYASDLSSGMYTYALIVDGKLIDTKKMMKTK